MLSGLILSAAIGQCASGQCAAPERFRPVVVSSRHAELLVASEGCAVRSGCAAAGHERRGGPVNGVGRVAGGALRIAGRTARWTGRALTLHWCH